VSRLIVTAAGPARQAELHRPDEAIRQERAGTALAARPAAALAVRERADGDQLLRDTRKFLRHFAQWPSEAALNVATIAAAAMNAKDPGTGDPVWEYAFKLLYTASEYGAGKSWLARLTGSLCPSPKVLLEPTKPSFIDEIADHRTVIVKEVDELLASSGRNRGLVAVMNACYEPGSYHTRKNGGKVQEIHLYGHQILDGKDDVFQATRPDTRGLLSRCIVIHVRMAPDGYRRPMWDAVAQAAAVRGQNRLAAWMATEVQAGMGATLQSLAKVPESVGNPRRYSLYEPLFTIAERADRHRAARGEADGYWTELLTESARQLEDALPDDADDADAVDEFMASLPDENDDWSNGRDHR
jgi:hypothetical protein